MLRQGEVVTGSLNPCGAPRAGKCKSALVPIARLRLAAEPGHGRLPCGPLDKDQQTFPGTG